MKNLTKITAILLLLFFAGNRSLDAQRGIRGDLDSTRMGRPGMRMDYRQMRGMRQGPDSLRMRDMKMSHFPMYGIGGDMHRRPKYGMRGDFRYRMINDMNRGKMGPGRFIENIPDLTDKQKKEIGDLRQSNMDEMKKVREDTFEKMKSMREANRSKILNILTEEQKKYLESKVPIDKTETQKSN